MGRSGEVVTFEGMDILYTLSLKRAVYNVSLVLTCIDSKGVYSLKFKELEGRSYSIHQTNISAYLELEMRVKKIM